jgi:hypothetical protein
MAGAAASACDGAGIAQQVAARQITTMLASPNRRATPVARVIASIVCSSEDSGITLNGWFATRAVLCCTVPP